MPPAAGREWGIIRQIIWRQQHQGVHYAFISADCGPDVFLHATDVDGLGISICEGDTVEYCVVDYKGRPKAVDVVKVLTSFKYPGVPVLRPIGSIDAAAASAGSDFEPDADATRPAPEPVPPPPPTTTYPGTPLSAAAPSYMPTVPLDAGDSGVFYTGTVESFANTAAGDFMRFTGQKLRWGFIRVDTTHNRIYVVETELRGVGRLLRRLDRVEFRIMKSHSSRAFKPGRERFHAIDVRLLDEPPAATDGPAALADRLAHVRVSPKTVAAQDDLDAAAVHQERLESSLVAHRAELRRLRSVLSQREIPDALTCPITLEIMQEPVIAHDGFTYERCAIESWLSSHRTSPKTGAALQSTILIDNHGVKQLIADFLDETRRLQAAIDASAEDETKAPS